MLLTICCIVYYHQHVGCIVLGILHALFITSIILEVRQLRLRESECHVCDVMEPEFESKSG